MNDTLSSRDPCEVVVESCKYALADGERSRAEATLVLDWLCRLRGRRAAEHYNERYQREFRSAVRQLSSSVQLAADESFRFDFTQLFHTSDNSWMVCGRCTRMLLEIDAEGCLLFELECMSRVRLHEVRPGIPSERIVIKGFSMGDALAFSAGFTCDKSLAGIIGLSSFLMQNSEAPGARFFDEVDNYLDEYDGEKAYEAAKRLISQNDSEQTAAEDRTNILCRFAQACYIRSNNCVRKNEERKAILTEAYEACKKAYELDPTSGYVLKWCCIITGSLADIASNKQKIETGHEFKKFLDEAVELTSDASIYHMRGRFAYEVANLSWLQRTVATELFGVPPTATADEALANLLKAEELNPGQLDNLLFIAKCYLAKGNTSEARTYLLQMREDVAVDEADEEMLEESKRLLQSIANTYHDLVEQTAKEMSFAESSSEEEELNSAIEAAD